MSPLPPLRAALLLLLALAGCTRPPPEAYRQSAARSGPGEPVGQDAQGESCIAQPGPRLPVDMPVLRARDIYCGGWTQPAARVLQLSGPTDAATLERLAQGGLWRTWLDQRVLCTAPPQATTVAGGLPARLLACTRRNGGWPHLALVVAGRDGPVVADGVATAAPVMESLAAGRSGQGGGTARSEALEIALRRLSAQAFSAKDVGNYEDLMGLGRELNQAEKFAAAEDAYRAALAVQQRVLKPDDPNTVGAIMALALNLSNVGRAREAETLFARAEALAPRAADPTAAARLLHYQGLAALNAGQPDKALDLLRRAEARYAALVPPSVLDPRSLGLDIALLADPSAQSALLGLSETRRNVAVALTRLGRANEASSLVEQSRALLTRAGLEQGVLTARSLRTEATAAARLGEDRVAARQLAAAARRFAIAAPGERPEAVTLFLAGQQSVLAGERARALTEFRAGAAILRARQIALPVELVLGYLDALDTAARADAARADELRAEMFTAMQLAQRGSTVRFVQQASARIGVAAGDPKVAEAVRRLQDADQTLRALFAERDLGASPDLDARISAAQQARAEAETEVAAAAPGYRQLLLSAVDAETTAKALAPNEVLLAMLLGSDHGWVLALRDGRVSASRLALAEAEVTKLVMALRSGVVDERRSAPGNFDPAPAQQLYAALLKPLEPVLEGVETLTVVPDGPLLAMPFGLLLAGPADPAHLEAAPFLIRRFAIEHIPSAQTLVTLRAAGTASRAPRPYIGFGDFVPPTQTQLQRSFPQDRCARDAELAAGLVRLPGTRIEVDLARQLTGAGPGEVRLGGDFTGAALKAPDVGQHRLIHLATHALLPGELSCLAEPAIVVSAPPGAADADAAFVRASDLLNLKLDADVIILSACNTGGPGGAGGGEALSGLARAFFYTGARGLLVTHWAVDDAAAVLTVGETLRRQERGASSAAALRAAQLVFFEEAGRRLPQAYAHPFYWAPFALIGDGRGVARTTRSAGRAASPETGAAHGGAAM
ncbi:MAG TPA: CHAT domain-containing tetratricopeptide repeat protein [Crenalkalicoccus sp.]|nr:CHAT domain-containing tetratricopeptide repeat protein [Crenalkalicoccus sp.]